jgi:[ribosomal protein S18]-alanine N-acetyltransferase
MPAVYFKRHKMQFDLSATKLPPITELEGLRFEPWAERQLGQHSSAKWESFRHEIDATVFPCLGQRDGCRQLMRDMVGRNNFLPEATWLALEQRTSGPFGLGTKPVGTIQGLRSNATEGAIQNIGVVPASRGQGIAKQLLARSLLGFREVGCLSVHLEVTIHNLNAIKLYESLGFVYVETVFKPGNVPIVN